ncbi:hypothetical protein TNCV_5014621 [Trichonephila clavipes]|nr:hypothetical protein TNCV_5014621 [Trichonephila clavipes]
MRYWYVSVLLESPTVSYGEFVVADQRFSNCVPWNSGVPRVIPSENEINSTAPVHMSSNMRSIKKSIEVKVGITFQDGGQFKSCQVIYSQFGFTIHQNDHQARRRFVEWAQNEIAVVPDFQKRILFSDEAHFWLNGYVNKQNCRIRSEGNPQVYVETPLHPEKLTVWCALWAGGIFLQKR